MASTQKEAHLGISTSCSNYFSLALVRTLLDGGVRAHIQVVVRLAVAARARHKVVIGREIKKPENLVLPNLPQFSKFCTRENFPLYGIHNVGEPLS